jgi:hypothetical protein
MLSQPLSLKLVEMSRLQSDDVALIHLSLKEFTKLNKCEPPGDSFDDNLAPEHRNGGSLLIQ